MRYVWIPEAKSSAPLYATSGGSGSRNIYRAIQFESKQACQEWCDERPHDGWYPVEHGFDEEVRRTNS